MFATITLAQTDKDVSTTSLYSNIVINIQISFLRNDDISISINDNDNNYTSYYGFYSATFIFRDNFLFCCKINFWYKCPLFCKLNYVWYAYRCHSSAILLWISFVIRKNYWHRTMPKGRLFPSSSTFKLSIKFWVKNCNVKRQLFNLFEEELFVIIHTLFRIAPTQETIEKRNVLELPRQ